MPTILETLLDAFQTGPCDFCAMDGDARPKRVYRDPETRVRYCLPCLELACTAPPLEDGPEDAETVALGRAVLDQFFSAPARLTA